VLALLSYGDRIDFMQDSWQVNLTDLQELGTKLNKGEVTDRQAIAIFKLLREGCDFAKAVSLITSFFSLSLSFTASGDTTVSAEALKLGIQSGDPIIIANWSLHNFVHFGITCASSYGSTDTDNLLSVSYRHIQIAQSVPPPTSPPPTSPPLTNVSELVRTPPPPPMSIDNSDNNSDSQDNNALSIKPTPALLIEQLRSIADLLCPEHWRQLQELMEQHLN
jgi:hypothetical protein